MTVCLENSLLRKIISAVSIMFAQIDINAEVKETESADAIARRILDVYGDGILRLAYSYVHNLCDAEEILQETVFAYIKKAPEINDSEHEKAWLLRVTANISKNRVKYNKLRDTDELSDLLAAEQEEELSFVWDAVKKLRPKLREVVHLHYYEGYKVSEIAKILSRNESTVRSDLYRARNKLREILKEDYDFE